MPAAAPAPAPSATAAPVVFRFGPYRFYMYPGDEGEPPHVHVRRDRHLAKVWLRTPGTGSDAPSVAEAGGFRAAELRTVLRTIVANRALLLAAWQRQFPDSGPPPMTPSTFPVTIKAGALPDVEQVEVHATAGGDGAPARTLAFHLADGRTVVVPVAWYPRLALATLDELAVVEMWGDEVEWPMVNEIVPVRFILEGVRGQEGAESLAEWQALMDRRRAQIARGEEPEPHYPTFPLPDGWDDDTDDDDAPDGSARS